MRCSYFHGVFLFSLFVVLFNMLCALFAFSSICINPSYLSNKKGKKKLQLICVMSFGQNDSV